jgi:protein-arginine kinase activator protein McsA
MSTKLCKYCEETKPIEEFPFTNKQEITRSKKCNSCHKKYKQDYYRKNRDATITRSKANNKIVKHRNIEFVFQYLLLHPCVDCGEKDPIKLEFDHRDSSEKEAGVAVLLQGNTPLDKIQREIAKCDVRCSNCHKVKTAMERNWWMYRMYQEYLIKTSE